MGQDIVILAAEDDEGHFSLIERHLRHAGLIGPMYHFKDGQEILAFFSEEGDSQGRKWQLKQRYILLLDIRMPKIDGIEVLKQLKKDEIFKKIPIAVFTTTDDPKEIDRCHALGCNIYVVKPVEYEEFSKVVQKIGDFISTVEVPACQTSQ